MEKTFDLINDLYFVRTGGSKEEHKAAKIIEERVKALGINDVKLEEFDVDGYNPLEAKLVIDSKSFDCVCVGMSGETPKEGIEGELAYVDSLEKAKILDLKDKICLIHSKIVNAKLYKELINKQVKGIILATGSVYKDASDVDLDPYMYREKNYELGKIPAVCIRMKDAYNIIKNDLKKAFIIVRQNEFKNKSHNVVATIKGIKDDVVCFTAHYDSVPYSRGAYDNATGSAGILDILAYFKDKKPLRTLKFIWCGSEEMGLLGSKAYVAMHKDELDKYVLNINIDMIATTLGYDIACVTAEDNLVHYINYLGAITGFAIKARQGVYSSDSTPFADGGVPSLSFARISPQGGPTIHSHDDVIDFLDEKNYLETCNFIEKFSDEMVNAILFPVNRIIPDNMKLELDFYNGRKDRPEK